MISLKFPNQLVFRALEYNKWYFTAEPQWNKEHTLVFCANRTLCLYIIDFGGFLTILLLFLSRLGPISRHPLLEKDNLNAPTKELKGLKLGA